MVLDLVEAGRSPLPRSVGHARARARIPNAVTLPESPGGRKEFQTTVRDIDQTLVEEVWREIASYPPGRVETEAGAFIAQQPDVARFAQSVTVGQDPVVQKAAFGLCFLLFRIAERSLGGPVPAVAEPRLKAAYEAARDWLQRAESDSTGLVHNRKADHLVLVNHVLLLFYGDGAADCDDAVRATLFLLLCTLTAALDLGADEA